METTTTERVAIDSDALTSALNANGYAMLPGMISTRQCDELKSIYEDPTKFRKTVIMERYRFGKGEYKYFTYPLPDLINEIRERMFAALVPVANAWMQSLGIDIEYPRDHGEFLKQCRRSGQDKATVLLLKYGKGGFNTMHQDLYGQVYFPFQVVLFLSQPGEEYAGGEFVLLEQIPRAQSRAIVLTPQRGDMLVFTTNFRPVKGSRGFYRVTMKHGVSEIREGNRQTLGIIFHDAAS